MGPITKAINRRMPGIKNLRGIETLVKYAKFKATIEITKNEPIAIWPDANAL